MAANSQFSIAVHVLAMLAKSCDERIKSDYLAKSVNTNPVVIRRLLCSLHEANLVVSQTGACGGTCLSKKAEDISLLEVFNAVAKSEVFSLHPNTPNQDCFVGRNIQRVLGGLQTEIDRAIEEKLALYTLRDVIESVEDQTAAV
ncbi:MAG: Rrf2 family transcriptional regulator [Acidobacteria bacterium]|nr:Rrf2 family transcriptional regulator [Acidobacteriota bacterium]MBK8146995.1 Rrf2 family transcriptional regulator [Acidobacteriota bacterium]MBK8812449.1 Rrf2 family transcriptional regulator [Acidobacteriota bacterium]